MTQRIEHNNQPKKLSFFKHLKYLKEKENTPETPSLGINLTSDDVLKKIQINRQNHRSQGLSHNKENSNSTCLNPNRSNLYKQNCVEKLANKKINQIEGYCKIAKKLSLQLDEISFKKTGNKENQCPNQNSSSKKVRKILNAGVRGFEIDILKNEPSFEDNDQKKSSTRGRWKTQKPKQISTINSLLIDSPNHIQVQKISKQIQTVGILSFLDIENVISIQIPSTNTVKNSDICVVESAVVKYTIAPHPNSNQADRKRRFIVRGIVAIAIACILKKRYGTLAPRGIWKQIFPKNPQPSHTRTS
jgi:hypothetical protein